jgi:hypothetical protein
MWEEATEIARRQVRTARTCGRVFAVHRSRRDEDIPPFYEKLIRKVKLPL